MGVELPLIRKLRDRSSKGLRLPATLPESVVDSKLKRGSARLDERQRSRSFMQDIHIPCYFVRRASGPILIDGKLEERDWRHAQRIVLKKIFPERGDDSPLRAKTQVAALWDEDNLYLAFEVEDQEIWATLNEHDARLFEEECVEFFLDPDGDGRRYIETQVNSLNTIRDLLVDGSLRQPTRSEFDKMALWHYQQLRSAVDIRPGWGWTLEAAVPWAEFAFADAASHPNPAARYALTAIDTSGPDRALSRWS